MKQLLIISMLSLFTINAASQLQLTRLPHMKKGSRLPYNETFRFPCGDSVGHGYYIAQGFQNTDEHLGLDISGFPGGDSDLGDTIYSIGHGIVDYAESTCHLSVLHKYHAGIIKAIYFHCDTVFSREGDFVEKGEPIATIGKEGTHLAHLHFEITFNLCFKNGLGGYGECRGEIDPLTIIPYAGKLPETLYD